MNEILNKNLNYINLYNKELSKKIAQISNITKNFQLTKTKLNEDNLSINSNFVHSQEGASEEAKRIFLSTNNSKETIHIIFGLGLGYLLDEFSSNCENKIILYEPDLEVLRLILEIVDFSNIFSKNNVRIVSNNDELKTAFFNFFDYKNTLSLSFLNYHKQFYFKEINECVENLKIYQGISNVSYDMMEKKSYWINKSFFEKLDIKIKTPYLSTLKNKFTNTPAIIVSAGSSLYDNLEILKEYQNNAIIFCVGTAFKTLISKGIRPHFVNIIEDFNVTNQIEGVDTSDINAIFETTTHPLLYNYKFKNKFLCSPRQNLINQWFLDFINEEYKDYDTRGTVSYNALFSANLLGCNPIILLGQDLAYVNNRCYAKGSPYHSLICKFNENTQKTEIISENYEELLKQFATNQNFPISAIENIVEKRLKKLNDNLTEIIGQNGNTVFTDKSFLFFIEYLESFAQMHKEEKIFINSSSGGANIKGYENIPFEEVCQKYLFDTINIQEILDNITKNFVPDKQIEKKLTLEIENLEKAINTFKKALDISEKLLEMTKTTKVFNQNINALLKTCIEFYIKINNEFFTKSKLISAIVYMEDKKVSHHLKYITEVNLENITNLSKLLSRYFYVGYNCGKMIIYKLKIAEAKFNENTNTTC